MPAARPVRVPADGNKYMHQRGMSEFEARKDSAAERGGAGPAGQPYPCSALRALRWRMNSMMPESIDTTMMARMTSEKLFLTTGMLPKK